MSKLFMKFDITPLSMLGHDVLIQWRSNFRYAREIRLDMRTFPERVQHSLCAQFMAYCVAYQYSNDFIGDLLN